MFSVLCSLCTSPFEFSYLYDYQCVLMHQGVDLHLCEDPSEVSAHLHLVILLDTMFFMLHPARLRLRSRYTTAPKLQSLRHACSISLYRTGGSKDAKISCQIQSETDPENSMQVYTPFQSFGAMARPSQHRLVDLEIALPCVQFTSPSLAS